ncbi:MAG: hypothetical protein AAB875_04060, partial [Patescibacteria group bacterium]
GVRAKSWLLLDKKLDWLIRNKKAFRDISAVALAKMASITFDKAQILSGEATEHIALKAQVNERASSGEYLTQLLGIRERTAETDES